MRQKKITNKLTFDKLTIAVLNQNELTAIQGGDSIICTRVTDCQTKCATVCCY